MTSIPPKNRGQPDKHNDESRSRIRQERLTHPEIELRSMVWPNEDHFFFSAPDTKLDIVEVYPDGHLSRENEIGHKRFASYCEARSLNPECMPALRLMYTTIFQRAWIKLLKLTPSLIDRLVVPRNGEFPEDQTTCLLHETFGVPISFFRKLMPRQLRVHVSAMFVQRNADGRPVSVDGHYRFCRGSDSDGWHVRSFAWFSQSLSDNTATYVVINCSESLKKLLLAVNSYDTAPSRLASPFAFHGLLLDDAMITMQRMSGSCHSGIAANVNAFVFQKSTSSGSDSAEILNRSLIGISTLKYEITHIIAILDFLKRVRKEYVDLIWNNARISDANQALESLASLKEEAEGLLAYVQHAEDKAAIKFNFDNTMQNEKINKINTEIARLTAQIAVDSKRDSSSMITMAVVTMFFLPGTFISALFSMVFFNVATDSTGKMTFTVSPFLWVYPAVTIPLTIVVFAVWVVWQKRRSVAIAHDLQAILNPPTEDLSLDTDKTELHANDKIPGAKVKKSARASMVKMKTFLRRVGRARKRSPQMPLNTGDIG